MVDPAGVTAVEESDLDTLPVQVVLEIGRLEMSLSELRHLAPGVVLPVSRNADDAVDVMVNGKRVGRASLVRVGDGLGFRMSRLMQDG